MTPEESLEARPHDRRGDAAGLMLAALGPPVVALVYQTAMYALMHLACTTWITWPMHVVTLLAVVATISGTLVGLRRWRVLNRSEMADSGAHIAGDAGPAELQRRRLVAIIAVSLGSLSTLTVVLMWIATLIFAPCQQ